MKRSFRTVRELAAAVESDPTLANEIKQDPAKALSASAESPLGWDKWIYRIVVLALGLTVLTAVGGAIYLAALGAGGDGSADTPEILVALGSAAVGALAGLLAPSPRGE